MEASDHTSGDPGRSSSDLVEAFIARWQGRTGGQERANYGMFLRELCTALAVSPPDPAGDPETNDSVFERVVKEPARDGATTSKRIDLYKRDCFVLEAKQSRQMGGDKEVRGQADLFAADPEHRGRRAGPPGWDVLMHNARSQAELCSPAAKSPRAAAIRRRRRRRPLLRVLRQLSPRRKSRRPIPRPAVVPGLS
jgi:hypothetical protein